MVAFLLKVRRVSHYSLDLSLGSIDSDCCSLSLSIERSLSLCCSVRQDLRLVVLAGFVARGCSFVSFCVVCVCV